ncbi:MAG: hypothetical protein Crog4KO_36340 [Crocinitomicaceae bacterium]
MNQADDSAQLSARITFPATYSSMSELLPGRQVKVSLPGNVFFRKTVQEMLGQQSNLPRGVPGKTAEETEQSSSDFDFFDYDPEREDVPAGCIDVNPLETYQAGFQGSPSPLFHVQAEVGPHLHPISLMVDTGAAVSVVPWKLI